jgi:hypothetical protein
MVFFALLLSRPTLLTMEGKMIPEKRIEYTVMIVCAMLSACGADVNVSALDFFNLTDFAITNIVTSAINVVDTIEKQLEVKTDE